MNRSFSASASLFVISAPPTRSLWPPMYLVELWTTMSAPRASGRCRTGDENVLSTRSEEHTSELQSQSNLVCRLLLEKNSLEAMLAVPDKTTSLIVTGAGDVIEPTDVVIAIGSGRPFAPTSPHTPFSSSPPLTLSTSH